jgi:uncharacterized protein YdiU (UPF0061 family)
VPMDDDVELVRQLLTLMQQDARDYTNTFRELTTTRDLANASAEMQAWLSRWRARLESQSSAPAALEEAMRLANPTVIPRNHQVEAALSAAVSTGDLGPFERLLKVLQKPFEETAENADYRAPAPPSAQPYQTFCGT